MLVTALVGIACFAGGAIVTVLWLLFWPDDEEEDEDLAHQMLDPEYHWAAFSVGWAHGFNKGLMAGVMRNTDHEKNG